MFPAPRHATPNRRFGWLVWLALLLPLAQSAAAWHALSHVSGGPVSSGDDSAPASQTGHCDLCLGAAALGGGAPLGRGAALPQTDARHAAAAPPRAALLPLTRHRRQLARAPPAAA